MTETNLRTLDILLFSARGYWFSEIVKWFTWSDISHVGIVLVDPDYIEDGLRGAFLFESGQEYTPDVITHKMIWGVQITDLDSLIKSYDGQIYRRRIRTSYDETLAVASVYHTIYAKPYDAKLIDFLRAETRMDLGSDCQRTNSFFCSAFLGFLLMKMGLLDTTVRFDLLQPKDFNTGGKIEKMLRHSTMEEVVRIK